jgi:hypothetical protein
VNAIGTVHDRSAGTEGRADVSWGADAAVITRRTAEEWRAEVAIPWAALGVQEPRAGARMGLELVREHIAPYDRQQWAPTLSLNNHIPERFGTLVLK